MGIAVELYFDSISEQRLRDLMAPLRDHGIPPHLERLGFRPHIGLSVFDAPDLETLVEQVRIFAGFTAPFPLTFSHLGAFPSAEGVIFLAPTFTRSLRDLHDHFHRRLAAVGLSSSLYYRPDCWVPHCSITTDIQPAEMALGIQLLVQAFQPFEVQCTSLGAIRFRPVETLAHYELRG